MRTASVTPGPLLLLLLLLHAPSALEVRCSARAAA